MEHVLADAIVSSRLLKVGGFLIFDDVKIFPGVERATTAVLQALEGEYCCLEVLHNEVRNVTDFPELSSGLTDASPMFDFATSGLISWGYSSVS